MTTVKMKDLLEAGVHFGHQTRRWNPKMRPYIFTERNGIYIVDLQRTLLEIQAAYEFVRDIAARGGTILFVGTKKQAQEPIQAEAERAGMPYVNHRWLGGMLTNWTTMKTRIGRLQEIEKMQTDGSYDALPKKEVLKLEAEREKLARNLTGIRDITELPKAVFIVDSKRELIAVAEATKLHLPIVGLIDTNCDPDEVDYVIPGNDDAIRSVALMTRVIADACVEGRMAAGLPIGKETQEEEATDEAEAAAPAAEPATAVEAAAAATETAPEAPVEVAAEPVVEEAPAAAEAPAPVAAPADADAVDTTDTEPDAAQ